MYIELLEKKIMEQQEELTLSQKMLENNRNPSKDKYSCLGVKSYSNNRQKYLDKLKDALAQNNEGLINTILGEMKNLFGNSGSDRLSVLNQLFNEIRELSIPESMRYVTECANDGTDMFSSHYVGMSAFKEHKQGAQDMSNKLNLTTNQIKSIQLMKGEILNLKETINQKFMNLTKLKSDLTSMGSSLYGTQDRFMSCLYPVQQAKLVLAVEELWNMKTQELEGLEEKKPVNNIENAKIEANIDNKSVDSLNPINGRKFSDFVSHEDNWSLGKRGQRGYSSDFNFHTLFEFLENDPLLERLNDQL